MDEAMLVSRLGALFAEDFEAPEPEPGSEPVPEPEVIEPVFSADEVVAAREAAWRDGHAAGLQEAADGDAAAIRQTITAIAEQFASEREAAIGREEAAAQAIAQLLLDSLAATFPALCARYGDNEVRSVVRAVLPALTQEPDITVRAHPHTMRALMPEMARLDSDFAAHVRSVECDAMSPGDVRIAWRNGTATRDATALWQQVAAVLVPAGLLRVDAPIREMADGN